MQSWHPRHVDPVDVNVQAGPPQHADDHLPICLLDALLKDNLIRKSHLPNARMSSGKEAGPSGHFFLHKWSETLDYYIFFCINETISWKTSSPVSGSGKTVRRLDVCLDLSANSHPCAGHSAHDVAPSQVRPVQCKLDGWLNSDIVRIIVSGRGKLECSKTDVAEETFNL